MACQSDTKLTLVVSKGLTGSGRYLTFTIDFLLRIYDFNSKVYRLYMWLVRLRHFDTVLCQIDSGAVSNDTSKKNPTRFFCWSEKKILTKKSEWKNHVKKKVKKKNSDGKRFDAVLTSLWHNWPVNLTQLPCQSDVRGLSGSGRNSQKISFQKWSVTSRILSFRS